MGRKISDGLSVRVTVPVATAVAQGAFVYLDGFLGMAVQQVVADPANTQPLVLSIEPCEYETSQLAAAAAFANVGDLVYFDTAAGDFTDVAEGNLFAGFVTSPRDAGDVMWFELRSHMRVGAAVAAVASADGVAAAGANPTQAEFDAVVLVANETKAQLNALLTALNAAGIIG